MESHINHIISGEKKKNRNKSRERARKKKKQRTIYVTGTSEEIQQFYRQIYVIKILKATFVVPSTRVK